MHDALEGLDTAIATPGQAASAYRPRSRGYLRVGLVMAIYAVGSRVQRQVQREREA